MSKPATIEDFDKRMKKRHMYSTRVTVEAFEKLSRKFTRVMIQDKLRAYFYFRINILHMGFMKLDWLEKHRITIGDDVMEELTAMNKAYQDKRMSCKNSRKYLNSRVKKHNKKFNDTLELIKK